MSKKFLPLLALLFLTPAIATGATPLVKQLAEVTVNVPSPIIYSVTPYYNGVVVTMGFTNFTVGSGTPTQQTSVLYVYFLNGSARYLMLKTTTSSYSSVVSFVMGGKLYVVVSTNTGPGSSKSDVYVFEGLRLVNTYTVDGFMAYLGESKSPPFNLTAPVLIKTEVTGLRSHVNFTIVLNNTNITLADQLPVMILGLPQGILAVSQNISYAFRISPFESFYYVPLIVSLYSYNGKPVWIKEYKVGYYSGPTLSTSDAALLTSSFVTVVGDQLFIKNVTGAPTSVPSAPSSNVTVNATVIGISLKDGSVATRFNLTGVPPTLLLLNIGNGLYVMAVGQKEAVVQKFNGTGLVTVAKVPLATEVKKIVIGGYVEGNRTVYRYSNYTELLTSFLYHPGKYLLILSPTISGTNVTDVYPGGVIHYTLEGNATGIFVAHYAVLLNESRNFSLAFFDNNGTLKGIAHLGNLSYPTLFGFLHLPGVRVVELNDYSYYVVTESPNSTNSTNIVLYEVTFPKPATSTVPPTSSAQSTPSSSGTSSGQAGLLAPVAVAVVVILVAVAALLALRRRR